MKFFKYNFIKIIT